MSLRADEDLHRAIRGGVARNGICTELIWPDTYAYTRVGPTVCVARPALLSTSYLLVNRCGVLDSLRWQALSQDVRS